VIEIVNVCSVQLYMFNIDRYKFWTLMLKHLMFDYLAQTVDAGLIYKKDAF